MRQVVLDTETTGLDPAQGHRVIEIGCRELINRRLTDRSFHHYLQPDRKIDLAAAEVHGITDEFLLDKPHFSDIVENFLLFIRGAEVIIHNAPFDAGFIDHELTLLGTPWGRLEDHCTVVDTLLLARELHPGQKNSLDALCKRYSIDNSQRALHGALLDAEILADVYLAMTGGQTCLELAHVRQSSPGENQIASPRSKHSPLRVIRASTDERVAHESHLEAIDKASGGRCLWKKLLQ